MKIKITNNKKELKKDRKWWIKEYNKKYGKMAIKINKETAGKILDIYCNKIYDAEGNCYMFLPYWFEKVKGGYIAYRLNKLPEKLKEIIKRNRVFVEKECSINISRTEIIAKEVLAYELRKKTGHGLAHCIKALEENDSMEDAIVWLREKGDPNIMTKNK